MKKFIVLSNIYVVLYTMKILAKYPNPKKSQKSAWIKKYQNSKNQIHQKKSAKFLNKPFLFVCILTISICHHQPSTATSCTHEKKHTTKKNHQ